MIDLHTHTTYSDGTDSPLALVKKAAASGITVLGVTQSFTLLTTLATKEESVLLNSCKLPGDVMDL